MAAPTYTEDLTDLTTAESNTSWVELTGTIGGEAYNQMGTPAGADGDYPFIQGSYSVTQDCSKNTAVGSLAYNNGSGTGGHGTDGAYFVWQNYMVASNVGNYASGGFQICVGSGLGDFDAWYVGGVDKSPYPYGGWVCNVANTTVTPDGTAGTPTATEQYIGSAVYVNTGSSKGEVHNCDVIRYGRGSAIFQFGEAANYATIAGFATQNDNSSNRWGLIQEVSGGYLWKGRMQLGTSTNAVDFRDSSRNIFVQWTPKVTVNFNLIECINASSNIEMTGFTFTCLDTTTASQGRFLMTDQCDVSMDGCTFVDMDTFVFDKGGTKTVSVTDSVFRRCALITSGGGTFTGCTFDNPTGAIGVTASSPANAALISASTFNSDGTGNGLEVTGTAANFTLTNVNFNGYDTANPGTAANKAIYINIASGTVNLTISGGSGVTADHHVRTAGATVNVLTGAVNVTVKAVDDNGDPIQSAFAHLRASNATGPFPYQETVTISRSGTTATVTHTGHGMASNDKVLLRGISNKAEDDTVHQITVTGANAYTYTTTDAGPTTYNGTAFVVDGQDETSYDNSPTTEGTFAGGTGHAVSDVIRITGGSLVTVDAVSSGVVTQFTVNAGPDGGEHSATDVLSQRESTGSGTGFSLTLDTDNITTIIKSTFVALNGTTDAQGEITVNRVYSTDQPVVGWTRKSSSAPYYKQGAIVDTIDNVNGLTATSVMVSDE